MSLYVLDTDTLTLFQQGHSEVHRRVLAQPPNSVAITVLTVEEQLSGWYTEVRKAKRPDRLAWAYGRLAANVTLLSQFRVLVYDEPAINRAAQLRKLKINIGRFDLRIASVVLEQNGILVTCNAADFGRVPGLTIEDWSV